MRSAKIVALAAWATLIAVSMLSSAFGAYVGLALYAAFPLVQQ